MKRLPLTAALASLLLAAPLVSCKTPSSALDIDALDQPGSEPDGRTGGEAATLVDPLPVEHPTDLLPDGALFLVEASDPREVLELFDPLRQVPDFGAMWGQVTQPLGADPLVAADWAKLGIDIEGPMGVGLLDAQALSGFVYFETCDAQLFEDSLDRIVREMGGGDEIAKSDLAMARVLRLGDELSIVLREGVALFLFTENPERAIRDYTATAATLDPRESLGHSETFRWARSQLRADDDGMIFVNPKAVFAAIDAAQSRDNEYGTRYAQEQLDEARRRGAPSEEITMLEERLAEERRWSVERQRQRTGEQELIMRTFGAIDLGVITGDLTPAGVDAKVRLRMAPDALFRRLFAPMAQESPLMENLDNQVLAIQEGQVDVDAAVEFLTLIAQAEGESLADINQAGLAFTGIDFLGDILPTLRGDAGIGVTLDRAPDSSRLSEIPKSLGGAVYVGLRDPAVMKRSLDTLARKKALGGAFKASKGRWAVDVPDWRKVELDIVGDRLLISTDSALFGRVAQARPGRQAAVLADSAHPARGGEPTPAMRTYWSWTLMALTRAGDPYEQRSEDILYGIHDHPELTAEQSRKVKKSRAFKSKKKEFDQALVELNRHTREQAVLEFERTMDLFEQLGDFGLQIAVVEDGLRADMRWRYTNNTPPFVLFATSWMSSSMTDYDEWDRLQSRTWALREDLAVLRQQDLEAHAAKLRRKK